MKKSLMVLFTAMLLAFTALPALPSAAEVTVAQEEASYELPFKVLQEDNDEVSAAGKYVKSPAEVKVEDGKTYRLHDVIRKPVLAVIESPRW